MPVSEQPILQPQPRQPGVPLRRSTLAVLVLLLLAVGLLSSLLLSAGSSSTTTAMPVAQDLQELRRTGSDQALRDEEAEAARAAQARQSAASAAPPASTPASAWPPLPAGVRREDNSSAFFDRHAPRSAASASTRDRELELEAQTRMGKAVVADYDAPHGDTHASGAGPAAPGRGGRTGGPPRQGGYPRPRSRRLPWSAPSPAPAGR